MALPPFKYDHPAAFDNEQLVEDLLTLRDGEAVACPVYDYTIYDRTDRPRSVWTVPRTARAWASRW